MFDWTKIANSTNLGPHFTVGEWARGVNHGYLNSRRVEPEAPLAVITVAELARIEFNKLIDALPLETRKDHPRGFLVSSGVRTPASNRGAQKSRHMCGADYCAMDFRPQGNWNGSVISYDDFYGCFIRALDQVTEHFGIGYYPRTKAGIHIDCSFELRKGQHRTIIRPFYDRNAKLRGYQDYELIPIGYRWGPNGYSFRGNENALTDLHRKYHDPDITPHPWRNIAATIDINLELTEGSTKPPTHKCCK